MKKFLVIYAFIYYLFAYLLFRMTVKYSILAQFFYILLFFLLYFCMHLAIFFCFFFLYDNKTTKIFGCFVIIVNFLKIFWFLLTRTLQSAPCTPTPRFRNTH